MAKPGKLASVKYTGVNVAGMGTWNLSGFSRETLEDTEFGDDVKTFVFGPGDGGTIDFSGLYDPTDSTGQAALDALIIAGTVISNTTLRFYVDAASYWTISSGGSILITKGKAVSMDKSGLGQVSFSAKVSGIMYLV
jgi:hypothetical protein